MAAAADSSMVSTSGGSSGGISFRRDVQASATERMEEDRRQNTTSETPDCEMDVSSTGAAAEAASAFTSDPKRSEHSQSTEGGSDSDSNECPLFMTSLPRDFATNNGLAAIASLLGETVEESDDDSTPKSKKNIHKSENSISSGRSSSVYQPRSGGGKVGGASARRKSRGGGPSSSASSSSTKLNSNQSRHKPYSTPSKKSNEKQKANVGEAQLFLSMWKM